jgi:oligopeptidase B
MKTNKILLSIPAGQIIIDPWAIHENHLSSKILVSTPNNPIHIFMLYNKSLIKLNNPVSNLVIERNEATSADGTIVNYATVYKKNIIPKHLLVIGYGAYGMPTSASYARMQWNPLLENDWGIVYTFIRGGGDHTEAWAKAGRRDGRIKTIEDYLACVKAVKTQYNLQANDIVLYGRSAGGLLLGAAIAMEPSGNLFGGVFCEVPYVDELRTTTNLELPLTQLEYNEFGNPIHRLIDFLSVGKLSPADSAVGLKTPNIFVYCKTAVNDSEVFTYEPVKWVTRLRAGATKGKPKLLKIDLESGHFTSPEKVMKTYAFDCAIIDSLLK